jgi:hypothetical protein
VAAREWCHLEEKFDLVSHMAQKLIHISVSILTMADAKAKLARKTLRLLTSRMAKPRIAASALKALRHKARQEQRELVVLDSLHGYECSWCGCRFAETAAPSNVSLFEKRHAAKVLREKKFLEHICSESYVA